jgi:hypothetical protein
MTSSALRGGSGILLLLLGVVCISYSAFRPPAAFAVEVTYFAFSFAMFSGGLWLILRKGR